jgi:hypothetical protein
MALDTLLAEKCSDISAETVTIDFHAENTYQPQNPFFSFVGTGSVLHKSFVWKNRKIRLLKYGNLRLAGQPAKSANY